MIDNGRLDCSRCGGVAIGTADVAPVLNEEVSAPAEDTRDLESLTKKEVEAELTKLGVEFKTSESKAELFEKLKEAVEASAVDVEDAEEENEEESEDDESEEDSEEDEA